MEKSRRGPKYIKIDEEQFTKLCELQCTQEEIAGFFRCSPDTVERWCERHFKQKFAEIFKQKRQSGKISLRRAQFQAALKGNTALLIWLGKQYLDQSEKIESKTDLINKIMIEKLDETL